MKSYICGDFFAILESDCVKVSVKYLPNRAALPEKYEVHHIHIDTKE